MTFLSMKIEARLDGVNWTDISADILGNPSANSGIFGNADQDRVASVGQLNLQFDNSIGNSVGKVGYYSPGGIYCRTGFAIALPIRVVFSFDSISTPKWRGEIAPGGILATGGIYNELRSAVTCYDWMYQATIHRLRLLAYTTNKRGDEALVLILANMPKQPGSTSFDIGDYTFTSIFDSVREYTTAMAEFQKICQSERSYLYVRHNRTSDEQLVWENRTHRNDVAAVSEVSAPSTECAPLLDESDLEILDEDGAPVLEEGIISIFLDNAMCEMEPSYGANLFNKVVYTVYPKDPFSGTLCATKSRIALEPGETKTGIKLTFRDPSAISKVCAQTITPLDSGTDYDMTANNDGSGADLTASLILSYVAGVEGIECSIQNTGVTKGHVYIQARGTGLRIYDPVSKITEDSGVGSSQETYGVLELTIDAPYQNDPVVADGYAAVILAGAKGEHKEIIKATFLANTDAKKQLFLETQIGSRIHLAETVLGIDEDYFVQGEEWEVVSNNTDAGLLIKYSWYVKRAALDVYAFWELGTAGKTELGVTTILSYTGV